MLARLLSSMHMAAGRTFSRCVMACWLNWRFLSALRLRERVLVVCVCRHLRLEPFCFRWLTLFSAAGRRLGMGSTKGELFTVGESPVVFDAVVHAVVVLEGDVVEFRWLRAFFVDCYV